MADHQAGCPILSDQTLALGPDESHHAARVLRIEEGSVIEVTDGQGFVVQGRVESNHKTKVTFRVIQASFQPAPRPQLWVAAAVPKAGRPDDMVDQLTQVNATGWIPLITARSVVDPRQSKLEKLRKTAIAATKQAGRAHLLQILDPMTLDQALARPAGLRLWASTTHDDATGQDGSAMARHLAQAGDEPVILYIGPEGGWTDQETQQALDVGAEPWRLGAAVMRIETAATAGAAIAMYLAEFQDKPR